MNDLKVNESGLFRKAAALLNNKNFSDVDIVVINDGAKKHFPAHKLFLAMNSEKFAEAFYRNPAPSKVHKIFDFKPKIVFMMLEFMYKNKVNLSKTNEARELYTLSKEYGIRNLQELCVDYISRNEVNNDNVLYMYECALRERFLNCLNFCRNIVSSNMKAVIESQSFTEMNCAVLEDILKLDTLAVDSELDIIHAVARWASHKLKQRNLNDQCNFRDCIFPFLCHIRFLNLKYKEFCDIVEKYPIFTAQESSVIMRKMLQLNVCLPSHICQITRPRMYSLNIDKDIDSKKLNSLNTAQQSISNEDNRKMFDFSLHEAEKTVSSAFEKDVNCTMSLSVLKGVVLIYGVELKIEQNHNTSGELITVILGTLCSMRSTDEQESKNVRSTDTFNEELKNGTLTLLLNEPMKILQDERAEIEVTVEDLKLNRCYILKDSIHKMEHCSEMVAEFKLTSNQMSENGDYFFLISRLIYSLI